MTTTPLAPGAAALERSSRAFSSRRTRWIGGLALAGYLSLLFVVESAHGTRFPLALIVAGLTVFAGLCALKLEAAFCVVLALTPFSTEMRFPGAGGALQIPTEPMLFLTLGAWALRVALRRPTTLAEPRLTGALLLALGACLLSLAGATHRLTGLKAVTSTSWYALYGIFLMNNFARTDRLHALAGALTLPALVVTLGSMLLVLSGHYERGTGYWAGGPFFTEHGSFSAYLSFGMAVAAALALESAGLARLCWWSAACLIGLQVFLSLTRGAWLGMGALALFLVLLYWRRLLRPSYVALIVLACLGASGVLVGSGMIRRVHLFTKTTSQPNYTSNLERINRWYAGLRMFQASPITGVGWGTYPDHYMQYRRFPAGTDQSSMRMGIHSEYFRVFVETGMIGGAAAVLVALLTIGVAITAIRGAPTPYLRGLAVGCAGGLLTYAVHAVVNNFMAYDKVALPVWSCIGGLAAIAAISRHKTPAPLTPR